MADISEEQLHAAVSQRATQVKQLIAQRKNVDAVLLSLQDPPLYSKNMDTKQTNAEVVFQSIQACNKTDIKNVIAQASPGQQDVLMKYIYRGLEKPKNNALFLEWHGKLTERAGTGCIIRTLTDRKTV